MLPIINVLYDHQSMAMTWPVLHQAITSVKVKPDLLLTESQGINLLDIEIKIMTSFVNRMFSLISSSHEQMFKPQRIKRIIPWKQNVPM